MIIPFDLQNLFCPGSSPEENAESLQALLECLIELDIVHLKNHPQTPNLYDPRFGVVYGRTQEWQTIPALWLKRHGDCKSLAAMRIAELRVRGQVAKPVFRYRQNPQGGTDYHILVQTGPNEFEDPSKILGMGNEWAQFR